MPDVGKQYQERSSVVVISYIKCRRCDGSCTVFGLEGREKCPECLGNGQVVLCSDPEIQRQKTEALIKSNTWEELKKTPQEWAYDAKDREVAQVEEIKKDEESS